MAFRNIIINNRCKLSYSMNCLIIRKLEDEAKICLDEIRLIVVNNLQVSITTALISELSKHKIKIIFCNEKNNPECEMVSYQNNYYSYRKLKEQINFTPELKDNVWSLIIKEKIKNEARLLLNMNKLEEYNLLKNYINEVDIGDTSNREGHAAKVYFNALFGNDFSRREKNDINKYLNYGYSIIVALINRQIKALGYFTEIGIHHIGDSNSFNLTYDLIEPLRSLIDSLVVNNIVNDDNYKNKYVELLSTKVIYNNKEFYLDNAIDLYVEDILASLKENNLNKVRFIKYEL